VHEEYAVDTARGSIRNDEAGVSKLEEDVLRVLPAGAHGHESCDRGNGMRGLALRIVVSTGEQRTHSDMLCLMYKFRFIWGVC
jgi:hypothetical protein